MEKGIVFCGPNEETSSENASVICAKYISEHVAVIPAIFENPRNKRFWEDCNEHTKIVWISNVCNRKDLIYLILNTYHGITVDRKMRNPFEIHPMIIITTGAHILATEAIFQNSSIARRFDVIDCE